MTQNNVISKPSHSIQIKLDVKNNSSTIKTKTLENIILKSQNIAYTDRDKDESIFKKQPINFDANDISVDSKAHRCNNIPDKNDFLQDTYKTIYNDRENKNKRKDDFSKLQINFIVNNLNFDRRVKKFEQLGAYIYVYFWCIAGSISFYKQYYYQIEMNFRDCEEYIIENLRDDDIWRLRDVNTIYYESLIYHENISVRMAINTDSELAGNQKQENKTFEEQVKHFTQLSKFFSPAEVKNFEQLSEKKRYEFVFTSTKELCVGVNTNVLMQNIICRLSNDELDKIVDNLGFSIGPICATKHGAYVIQILMSILKSKKSCKKVKMYMGSNIVNLLKHPIGNYTAQKMMNFDIRYIKNIYQEYFVELLLNDFSYKVFKKCYDELAMLSCNFKNLLEQNTNKLPRKRYEEIKTLILDH